MNPYYLYLLVYLLSVSVTSCAQKHSNKATKETASHPYTNALIHESSPYLLQHAHNPVQWYPWGEKALNKAKQENKMLLISIGYAACHWCHVMEHESFEDSAVAQLMNDHFVCIKVDREERPDVDQVYMAACQLINQSGGWPLNAIALPNGKPFYAGTYYPKEDWTKVLNHFIRFYKEQPEKLQEAAKQITEGVAQSGKVGFNPSPSEYTMEQLDRSFDLWATSIDFEKGGFNKGDNKFPLPSSWDYLLRYATLSNNSKALEATHTTLKNMAWGGIYDQLGGGFARYSTDAFWKAPHFEKMLYDNGQLVSLYAQAYQHSKNPLYKKVVYETLEWVEREMTSPEGGFYASLDADSEGEEGKFYVWKAKEIKAILAEDAALFMDYYNCTEGGNWEQHNNILLRKKSEEKIATKYQLTIAELQEKIALLNNKMLQERSKRIRPGLDDKILTSWNAIMLTGYVKAYRAFGEEKFLTIALKNADFLIKNVIPKDYKITRNYKDGKAVISGFLDDYAFLIRAFIELYQVTFEEKWLQIADTLTEHTLTHFFQEETGMFNYTPNYNANLVARKMEVTDNVIPASNSEMANNLYLLGLYFYNKDYHQKAKQMLANVSKNLFQSPTYFSNWSKLMLAIIQPPYEVAIMGNDFETKRKEFDQYYLPNVLFMGGTKEGNLALLEGKMIQGTTTIYVCQNKACKRPLNTTEEALKLLSN
ncbi:thioredoxin domain-containing protein [Aureispira anguillae]|uniref:Thioredoxin domain-containing protein n=1 Tax=Aureispira anguillae TaxID=2864201 RepID=A0A915YCU9_9BACT|nr:thioredoxin domain-containing protein [Aureispira anguillae]BDS10732.1 thioredoxin domain-containing protein [Aureispira anguillae]